MNANVAEPTQHQMSTSIILPLRTMIKSRGGMPMMGKQRQKSFPNRVTLLRLSPVPRRPPMEHGAKEMSVDPSITG